MTRSHSRHVTTVPRASDVTWSMDPINQTLYIYIHAINPSFISDYYTNFANEIPRKFHEKNHEIAMKSAWNITRFRTFAKHPQCEGRAFRFASDNAVPSSLSAGMVFGTWENRPKITSELKWSGGFWRHCKLTQRTWEKSNGNGFPLVICHIAIENGHRNSEFSD